MQCAKFLGSGCQGGSSYLAFSYLKRNGVTSEEAMPYTASDGFCMSMFRSLPDEVSPISDYCIRSRIRYTFLSRTEEVSEEDMRRTLVAVGPLYVAMNANPMAQRNYRGGVYEGADCTTAVNHAVTLVGECVNNILSFVFLCFFFHYRLHTGRLDHQEQLGSW